MVKFKSKNSGMRLFKVAVVLIAALVVVISLPRENKFGYEYEMGRPWKYGQLIASYDFPIYKPDAQLKRERDSVKKLIQPYFTANLVTESRAIKSLREDYTSGRLKGVPYEYVIHLVEMLHRIYGQGIMSGDQLNQLTDSGIPRVHVVVGQESSTQEVAVVFSPRTAYEYVLQADTLHFSREIMRRTNFNNYLEPNLILDTAKTMAQREDLLGTISPASGMVQTGQKIIDRGEIVSQHTYNILQSLEKESLRRASPGRQQWMVLAGQLLAVIMLFTLFLIYLHVFRRDYYNSVNSISLLFTFIAVFPAVTGLMVSHNFFSVYLVPYALVPIFVRVFMDSRTAFVTLVITTLLSSLALHNPYEFILIQIVSGQAAIFSLHEMTKRSQLLRVAIITSGVALLFSLAYDLVQGLNLKQLDTHYYTYLVVNGVTLLFAYPLMYVIERMFGFTSSITLIELSDTNNGLLQRMSKEAQGTFNHSMQVANLAAEVANKIGAKTQLVRTGALYHDIGKIKNAAFFTENQSGTNPHDQLSEEQSAQVIIGHVIEGLRLAEKHHLPRIIRDFIYTHHGTSKVKFFYIQYCNKHPGETVDERLFTYPGPNPFTREQAILMMADAVEATSRSLKNVTEESLREMVDRIVDGMVREGNFKKCPITFRDIDMAKDVFVESLKTIYHTRISYPELKAPQPPRMRQPRHNIFDTGFFSTHD